MNWYKKASYSLSNKEKKILRTIIRKIMQGQRNWTTEELQLQQNFPDMIETTLMQKYKELR